MEARRASRDCTCVWRHACESLGKQHASRAASSGVELQPPLKRSSSVARIAPPAKSSGVGRGTPRCGTRSEFVGVRAERHRRERLAASYSENLVALGVVDIF